MGAAPRSVLRLIIVKPALGLDLDEREDFRILIPQQSRCDLDPAYELLHQNGRIVFEGVLYPIREARSVIHDGATDGTALGVGLNNDGIAERARNATVQVKGRHGTVGGDTDFAWNGNSMGL